MRAAADEQMWERWAGCDSADHHVLRLLLLLHCEEPLFKLPRLNISLSLSLFEVLWRFFKLLATHMATPKNSCLAVETTTSAWHRAAR